MQVFMVYMNTSRFCWKRYLLCPLHSDTVVRDCLVPRCSSLIGARYAGSYGLIGLRKTQPYAPHRRSYNVSQRLCNSKCCSEYCNETIVKHVHVMGFYLRTRQSWWHSCLQSYLFLPPGSRRLRDNCRWLWGKAWVSGRPFELQGRLFTSRSA